MVIPRVIFSCAALLWSSSPTSTGQETDLLAILTGTLRTEQRAACDGDYVVLKCPQGTAISIQLTHYGRKSIPPTGDAGDILCPPSLNMNSEEMDNYNRTCLSNKALKWVVEKCQQKRECKLRVGPETFDDDPCPDIGKYLEVAYKCRPSEFRRKVICQGDDISLKCSLNSRLAIYSADFGRQLRSPLECRQPDGVPEEDCQSLAANRIVMERCHGKRECFIRAAVDTFGDPCTPQSNMYLKIMYTCVPKEVLKSQYQNVDEGVGTTTLDYSSDVRAITKEQSDGEPTEKHKIMEAIIPKTRKNGARKTNNDIASPDVLHGSTEHPASTVAFDPSICINVTAPSGPLFTGYVTEWISAYNFMSANSEKVILYLVLSVALALLAFLSVLVVRLYCQKRRMKKQVKMNNNVESIPIGFSEELSDVDGDIDLTSHPNSPPVTDGSNLHLVTTTATTQLDVVRYANGGTSRPGTLRRQDSDTSPRTLYRNPTNSHMYS